GGWRQRIDGPEQGARGRNWQRLRAPTRAQARQEQRSANEAEQRQGTQQVDAEIDQVKPERARSMRGVVERKRQVSDRPAGDRKSVVRRIEHTGQRTQLMDRDVVEDRAEVVEDEDRGTAVQM